MVVTMRRAGLIRLVFFPCMGTGLSGDPHHTKSAERNFEPGTDMAANGEAQNDMPAHVSTYSGFLTLLKVGAAVSFVTGFIVILLISR